MWSNCKRKLWRSYNGWEAPWIIFQAKKPLLPLGVEQISRHNSAASSIVKAAAFARINQDSVAEHTASIIDRRLLVHNYCGLTRGSRLLDEDGNRRHASNWELMVKWAIWARVRVHLLALVSVYTSHWWRPEAKSPIRFTLASFTYLKGDNKRTQLWRIVWFNDVSGVEQEDNNNAA